jgi:hypothetical protein
MKMVQKCSLLFLNFISDSSPLPFHEFNDKWVQRTHPYNPFFSLERMASKEIGPDGKMMEGNEFKIELIYMNFDGEALQSYQDWLTEMKFAGKIRNPALDSKKVQEKLLEIANILGKMNGKKYIEKYIYPLIFR